ncbi:DUF4124 domain-containing protein [Alkanindiges sp. WGS2144]|uniref:DUF4124 domain-containing protein n=1 Tax=Alkanindiges sp. WGS2144 TaxID=3366808 RepID=UPI0037525C6D
MLNKKLLAFAVLATLISTGAQAAIYKSVDAQGNVVYSDSPSKDAKTVDLPPLAIVPSLSAEQIAQANATQRTKPAAINYQLSFAQPTADQVVRKPEPVSVSVDIRPALANGDVVTILLDGTVIANSNAASVSTEALDRGAHSISARITNATGKVVSETSTTFHVLQNSVNSPTSQANKPKPAR